MNLKTTLALLAVLGVLLLVYLLKSPDAPKGARDSQKMAAGYEASKVARIRIENVERNEKILLTRSGDDWQMEEPVKVPADAVGARFLATYLADYDGTPAGDAAVKLDQLGLDKPRAIVEFELEPADSRPESKAKAPKWTVKIGSDDLKGNSIFLQVGDRVFKAPRTLYNSVAKSPADFRDRRVFTLTALDVDAITLARSNEIAKLRLEEGEWRIVQPFQGKCAPGRASKLVDLTGLRVETFENDLPADLAPVGLDMPRIRLTLSGKGKSEELWIGNTKAERTFIQRAGNRGLWSVNSDRLDPALVPTDELRDPSVLGSFSNDAVMELRWQLGEAALEFARDPVTKSIKLTKPREAAADRDAFEGVLKALQGLEADSIVSSVGANLTDFGLTPPLGHLELKLKDAQKSIRIDVGATRPEGAFLRRPGDDYLLRVPASALLALGKPFTEFVSRELVTISTYEVGQVEIDVLDNPASTHADSKRSLTFAKNDSNRWTRAGDTEEVKGFAEALDALMHVKATEILAAEPASTPLANPRFEIRVYRRLYNDPKGADKEKDRLGTLWFAWSGEWFGSGITGSATTGGLAAKVANDVPDRVKGLFPGTESKASSAPESKSK